MLQNVLLYIEAANIENNSILFCVCRIIFSKFIIDDFQSHPLPLYFPVSSCQDFVSPEDVSPGENKKILIILIIRIFYFKLCPRQESNLHELMLTTPSKWRVYQFHHLGSFAAAKIQLFYFLFTN